ncbi:hypothetical protein L2E82_45970 [Cichorium intybus]|uniref:Uncharacterized protein n=1 Tax=Cichorium intybus TaxID=13427 RepID=A0ACB8ZUB4_CICIN|nr:hypothetical protein L2E82_45970 [Cichorium intybus]
MSWCIGLDALEQDASVYKHTLLPFSIYANMEKTTELLVDEDCFPAKTSSDSMDACSTKSPRNFSKEPCIYLERFQVSSFHFTDHRYLQSQWPNHSRIQVRINLTVLVNKLQQSID